MPTSSCRARCGTRRVRGVGSCPTVRWRPAMHRVRRAGGAMRPPFTVEQFLDVFRRYNEAVLPMQAVLVLAALVIAGAAMLGSRRASRLALALLALLWLWMAVAYQLAFYTTLSALGYLFAALFVVEALLLLR